MQELNYHCSKNKVADQLPQLLCHCFFAYAICWFSRDAADLFIGLDLYWVIPTPMVDVGHRLVGQWLVWG